METKNTEPLPQEGNISQVPGTAAFATWLLMPIAFLSMATLCLWMGALMSVRCERAPSASSDLSDATHVSVTVERRLLGLIPIYRTTLPDVVGVGSVHGTDETDSPRQNRRYRSGPDSSPCGRKNLELSARLRSFRHAAMAYGKADREVYRRSVRTSSQLLVYVMDAPSGRHSLAAGRHPVRLCRA